MKEYFEMEFPDCLFMNSQKVTRLPIHPASIYYMHVPSARRSDGSADGSSLTTGPRPQGKQEILTPGQRSRQLEVLQQRQKSVQVPVGAGREVGCRGPLFCPGWAWQHQGTVKHRVSALANIKPTKS